MRLGAAGDVQRIAMDNTSTAILPQFIEISPPFRGSVRVGMGKQAASATIRPASVSAPTFPNRREMWPTPSSLSKACAQPPGEAH